MPGTYIYVRDLEEDWETGWTVGEAGNTKVELINISIAKRAYKEWQTVPLPID